MKTTSSKLFRGVMLIAALLVPTTTWWVSLRQFHERRQAESALAAEKNVQQQFAGPQSKRETPLRRLDSNSIEFAQEGKLRTSWNGQTDPDSVWHAQRRRANSVLVQHGLPALSLGYGAPPPRRIPAR